MHATEDDDTSHIHADEDDDTSHMHTDEDDDTSDMRNDRFMGADEETMKFYQLLEDASCELYPGCQEFTKLSFTERLLNLKVISGWTNKSFTSLLVLLGKDVVLKDLNSKWKQGKYEIKRDYFKPYMNDKEKLTEVPTCRLPQDQWSALVRFWELIKTQEEAERNAKNRSRYEFHHQLGRTPMLEVVKELEAANIEPSRIDLFARSRAWKGKCPLNENTRHIIHQLNHAVSQVPEQEKTRDMKEKIFTDIMGSDGHGRVRCMGQGITPSQYRQSLTSNDALKKKIRDEVIQEVRREMRDNIRDEMKEQLREEMSIQMNRTLF